jgi:hypothetical protein
MKKLSIILTTLIFLTACTAQEKQEDIFMQIASSQEYAKYMETIYSQSILIAQNQVDFDGIKLVFDMHPNTESVEVIGKEAFSNVKGGVLWYEYVVEFKDRVQELDDKYSFKSISKEQRMEISKLYEQITNGAERKKARDAAFHHLQNRQK